MSSGYAITSKPTLKTAMLKSQDAETRAFAKEVDEYYGVGLLMQTSKGRLVPKRLNEDTLKMEVSLDGGLTWQETN